MAGELQTCFECGGLAEALHHVVPVSRGGTKTVSLCGLCHGKAHHCDRNMTTSALTRVALQKKRERNEMIGQVPYGWRLVGGKKLEPVEGEQNVLRMIIELRSKGWTLRRITERLNSSAIPTKKGKAKWNVSTIQGICKRNLKEETYGRHTQPQASLFQE